MANRKKLSRSEAAKKAWDKRYRAMGIIPPRQRAKQAAAQAARQAVAGLTRAQLLIIAEERVYFLVGERPRFVGTYIHDRLDELTDAQLRKAPSLQLKQLLWRARQPSSKFESGINPFWYH